MTSPGSSRVSRRHRDAVPRNLEDQHELESRFLARLLLIDAGDIEPHPGRKDILLRKRTCPRVDGQTLAPCFQRGKFVKQKSVFSTVRHCGVLWGHSREAHHALRLVVSPPFVLALGAVTACWWVALGRGNNSSTQGSSDSSAWRSREAPPHDPLRPQIASG